MLNKLLTYCVFMLALFCLNKSIAAEPQEIPTLNVVVNHFPPWVIVSDDQESIRGIYVDIATELLEQLNYKVRFLPCPFSRCLRMMEYGQADLMFGLFKTEQREAYMEFIGEAFLPNEHKVFYLPVDSEIEINSYQDLTNLSIGFVRGTSYFSVFDQDNSLTKVEVNSDTQLLAMLEKSRIDTFIGTESTIDFMLQELDQTKKFKKSSYFWVRNDNYSYVGVAKKALPNIDIEHLEQVLEQMKKDGQLIEIMNLWLGNIQLGS